MVLSSETIDNIRTKLTTLVGKDINDSFVELEVRFGNFAASSFASGVDRSTFIRIRNFAIKLDPTYEYTHVKDSIFREISRTTTERYTTVYDERGMPTQSFRIIKERIQNYDSPEYFLRISISREDIDDQIKPDADPIYTREKKRWSIEMDNKRFRLDLTEVTTYAPGDRDPRKAETVYEVEIEVLKPKLENLDRLNNIVSVLLKEILGTLIIYTNTERNDIINRINKSLGSRINRPGQIDHTILSQARNIKARDMVSGGLIPRTNRDTSYSVTIKADGIRKLLFIDQLGIYLFAPPNSLMKIFTSTISQKLQGWHGTVVEGELIPKENLSENAPNEYHDLIIYFLMFDVLSVAGDISIRQQIHPNRLTAIDQIIRFMGQLKDRSGVVRYRFDKKNFFPFATRKEFYDSVNSVLDNNWPFKTDGLLFTPWNYQYDTGSYKIPISQRKLTKYKDILKWKPVEFLTIDFELRHIISPEGGHIELWSNDVGKAQTVPFIGTEEYPFDPLTMIQRSAEINGLPSGTIIEFRWNIPNNVFEISRIRFDKFKPNRIDFAQDTWTDIHVPVDEETIRGTKFSLIFRYHNRIKWDIFNYVGEALPKIDEINVRTRTLLCIGSGKGADVRKWEANGFTHAICIEPNGENRIELGRRLASTKLKYRIIATIGQDVDEIVRQVRDFAPNKAVEVVSYMLSLSFFFDNPESTTSILNLVNQTLMYGGYFTAFSIDGRYVLEFFGDKKLYSEDNRRKKANFRLIDFELFQNDPQQAKIYIDIPNSIVTKQIEYLTNIPGLQNAFVQMGFQTLIEERTDKESFMTNEELYFTKLFTKFIMKRTLPGS